MEVKKGYKKTELGFIPEDWEVVHVDELTSEVGDGIHSTPIYSNDGTYYFVNGNNLVDGKVLITKDTKRTDESEFKKHKKKLDDTTIFLSINGTIGNLAFYAGEPIILGKSAAYLNIKSSVSKKYVYFSLQTLGVNQFFNEGLTGTTIKNLGLGTIRKTPIALPSEIDEQTAIATALSDADALIQSLEKLITKKRNIKQGAMQKLLTGKKRLPGFSGEWETKTLAQLEKMGLVKLSRGKVISKKDIEKTPGVYPIYSSSVHNKGLFGVYGYFMFDEELITWSVDGGGHFFYRNKHKYSVTNVCGFMRLDSSRLCCQFVALQLQLLHSRLFFDYTMKAHPSVIRKAYALLIPPLSEQVAISEVFRDLDADIESLIRKRNKYKKIKQGMMQELLTGKTRLI